MLPVTIQNNQKYHSKNPLKKRLIARFNNKITAILNHYTPENIFDFGCGSALFWERAQPQLTFTPRQYIGVDQDPDAIAQATDRDLPNSLFYTSLDTAMNGIQVPPDFVICLEVLEHMSNPGHWLEKLCDLRPGFILLSVPNEPWFRLAQLATGKNIKRLGNDEDHMQNWSTGGFKRFVTPYLNIVDVETGAFPFTIVLGTPKIV